MSSVILYVLADLLQPYVFGVVLQGATPWSGVVSLCLGIARLHRIYGKHRFALADQSFPWPLL